MNDKESVILYAVDGGPCGGKSSGMASISQHLHEAGILSVIVPEAATLLINGGLPPSAYSTMAAFEEAVIELQLHLEQLFMTEASFMSKREGKPCVVFCDRGLLSAAAYLTGDDPLKELEGILAIFGLDIEQARARYAGVLHMTTAAYGAESFYTLDNNKARSETLEQARALDDRTCRAWLGHPHLAVVSNLDADGTPISFDQKLRRATAEVFRVIGYPEPVEIEDKYLVSPLEPVSLPVPAEAVDIEQTYLAMPSTAGKGEEERVRCRTWRGKRSFYHTVKRQAAASDARLETERIVSEAEYHKLLARAALDRQPIRKTRYSFVWQSQYFELDVFHGQHEGLFLLERERTKENAGGALPPFIEVIRDVTSEPAYKNSRLALKGAL